MKKIISLFLTFSFLLILSGFVAATPSGANVTNLTSSRANASDAGNHSAYAGNITELSISGVSITQSWQGYFGNVTGTIQLADVSDNVMYNWSLASPQGEIYASNASAIAWANIECANTSANFSEFEQRFGISPNDADGLDETFNLNNHPLFYTNSKEFGMGVCNNTRLYNNAGVGTFNEVLLTDGPSPVFTSILLNDTIGFDNNPHDFQMIVLEDGHGSDTNPTVYYFWVELE